MTTAVKVYKNNIFLGDATATVGSATLASYSGAVVGGGRNVGVTAVAGADAGKTQWCRVITDNTTNLVLNATYDYA
jgi:hypothetical protein